MSANKVSCNAIFDCNINPTVEQCKREYQMFLKEKALNQEDCQKENRKEVFEIIYKMAKCKSVFAYCHTCLVIYDKSQYGHNHLDSNSGSLKAYFTYGEKKTDTDKDEVLIQMFKDLSCYCVISDTLF